MVTRWLGVVAVAMWCLTGGAAMAEDKPDKPTKVKVDSKDVKVNINEASKTELMKLAGVGPGGAQKIIEYREAHGPFKKAQELEKVDGIGKGVLEKNAGRITVKWKLLSRSLVLMYDDPQNRSELTQAPSSVPFR
jgi:competence ComEA-like helix-hairpin-helix protein